MTDICCKCGNECEAVFSHREYIVCDDCFHENFRNAIETLKQSIDAGWEEYYREENHG